MLDLAPRDGVAVRCRVLRAFAALLLLTAVVRLPAFTVEVFNSDEAFVATQAQVIREGGNLYEDAVDRKPPLVPYLYAVTFAMFGTTELWTVRVLAMLAVALTALLLALEARRRYGARAGWVAAVLAVFASIAMAPQDGQAANFETFMLPAMTASILLARRGRGLTAGAAVAVATLTRQTGAAMLLPVGYLLHKERGRRGMLETAAGFAIPVVAVALSFGLSNFLYWTVTGNDTYVGFDTSWGYVTVRLLVMSVAFAAYNVPILWKLPSAWRARRGPGEVGERDTDLWLWLLAAVVSVLVGLRFHGHYFIQLYPPLCLLSAGALVRAGERATRVTVALAAIAAAGFSIAGYLWGPLHDEPRYEHVSRYVAAHARPSDRMLVWGSLPEAHWDSGVLPATRFITTNTFLAGNHPGRRPEDADPESVDPKVWRWFLEDFASHPPRFVLDTGPARIRSTDHTPIGDFPRLERLLGENYRRTRTIDRIVVYERSR